jgi:uncharacterized protein
MIRAVLDTNVVVSAMLKAGGTSSRIVKAGVAGHFQWVVSEALLREYQEVLFRPRFKLDPGNVEDLMKFIRASVIITFPVENLTLAKDPDDNKVIECAAEGRAEYVVTGNLRHFPAEFRGFRTVSPRNFLTILSGSFS